MQPQEPKPTPVDQSQPQPVQSQSVDNPAFPGTNSSTLVASSDKKKLYIILAVIVGVLLVGGIVLAIALSGKDKEEVMSPVTPATTTNTPSDDTESAVVPVVTGKIALSGKQIVDVEQGYTIDAKSLDIGAISIPEKYKSANSGKTIAILELQITKTGSYTGSPKNLALALVGSNGTAYSSTSLSNEDLKTYGCTPLSDAPAGDSASGCMAFWMPEDAAKTLTLRYKRPEMKIINNDTTIPAKEYTVALN